MAMPQPGPDVVREEVYNVSLAELLRERGVPARAERREQRGTPDVLVQLSRHDQILLECKYEGGRATLERQLDERLKAYPEKLGIVGVIYPDRFRYADDPAQALADADDLEWWLHSSQGTFQALKQPRRGGVADLATHIPGLPLEIEGTDRVIAATAAVGYALQQSSKTIGAHARIASRIAAVITESDRETNMSAALHIGTLVVFNALAFQDRLAEINGNVETVEESLGGSVSNLRAVWKRICDTIDYVPVFDLAERILAILEDAPRPVAQDAITPLHWAVRQTRTMQGHDLSGRLFHTLLSDAKFTGAYYTSIPAATMLAHLVFTNWPRGADWSDYEWPGSLTIADIACGTGTLLMAVAQEAERRHLQAGGTNAALLHKTLVEKSLHGYDVQLSAIHFAATSLAMLNPHIEFDRMNLTVMPYEVDAETVHLGSLDFLLDVESVPAQFALSPEIAPSPPPDMGGQRLTGQGVGARDERRATLPTLDLAIMNPPFTRANNLFGGQPPVERKVIQQELGRRLRSRGASSTAGLGSAFVATAIPKLREGEGRLALVLPLTVCTGPSWAQTRELIEREFTIDYVVTSHDPLRPNFSDSTDLSEALLVATRRRGDASDDEHRITFINLWHNPEGVFDAQQAIRAASNTPAAHIEGRGSTLVRTNTEDVGEVFSMAQKELEGRKWFGVQFARADVARIALRLLRDGDVWIPGSLGVGHVAMAPLAELGDLGPDGRRLMDGFTRTDSVTAYPMVEEHDTESRKTLGTSPNKYFVPLPVPRGGQRPGYGDHLWQQAAQLLLAERLRLNTARIVSMYCDRRVLSNVFWEVITENPAQDMALCLWLNSSLGVLGILATRNTTMASWAKFKKADLQQMPVLDVRTLSEGQLAELSALFDEIAEMEFERLPAMVHCPARRAVDDGLSRILGLPDLAPLRELLATEPVVSGKRL